MLLLTAPLNAAVFWTPGLRSGQKFHEAAAKGFQRLVRSLALAKVLSDDLEKVAMKRLGLLRHAKSDWDEAVKRDFDRGLNDRGRRGAALIGEHITAEDWNWDLMLASPAIRVKQTLEHARLGMTPEFDDRLYLASPETIIETLCAHGCKDDGSDEPESVLVVGHNPGLQETILNLVSPAHENDLFREASVKFPTAAFAVLECDAESWRGLKNYCAKLVHFVRPRDLDPELGPGS